MSDTYIDVNTFIKQKKKERNDKTIPVENRIALTPKQYAEKYHFSVPTVLSRLRGGGIPNAEKTGKRWRIYEQSGDSVSREEYEKVKDEAIRLQAILDGIHSISQREGQK